MSDQVTRQILTGQTGTTRKRVGDHRLFDRGAFTVTPDLHIQVSDRAHGACGFAEWPGAYHGKSLRPPQRPSYCPDPAFVTWHVREVFQGEARYDRR
jgi:putative restriction endonuclease